MILVDTSVWIDHFRKSDKTLSKHLHEGRVLMHPFVIGELALGIMRQREAILGLLKALSEAPVAEQAEVLAFIDGHSLAGSGIGFIDAHLLASVRLSPGSHLWTRDKRLHAVAEGMGLAYEP